MKVRLRLSQEQFDKLDQETRRRMIYQLMFIDTPHFRYAIGAQERWWTMVRYELHPDRTEVGDSATIVDRWL